MAPNADAMCRALARHLERALEIEVAWIDGIPWDERERMFDRGEIDLCWLCGLPYADKVDAGDAIEVGVAPVMCGARYNGKPVYFSDVMVRADSPYTSFADLLGASWAYNEPRSHSGYNIVRYHLARAGQGLDFFGRAVEAGSHQAALSLILEGAVAAAAIDSTVFEAEARRDPSLWSAVRAIETLGPSPAPPWVFSAALTPAMRAKVRDCLAQVHLTPEGAALLASWGIRELRPVDDAAYDLVRHMARVTRAAARDRFAAPCARLPDPARA